MLGGASLLFSGNLASSLIILFRNVLIARLISVENFGIASTFAIAIGVIEMLSNVSLDRMIVQAKDGERPDLQRALQGIQVVRGAAGAALMFVLAGVYASVMGLPDIVWAFQLLALYPLLRAFTHLDVFRFQRAMRFAPHVVTQVASQALSLLAVWPLAWFFGDFQVTLWAILAQQAMFLVLSHAFAERRYGIGWDRATFNQAMAFGLPLLGNAVLVFATFNGDRAIIANQIGMETLGWFSVALTLTLAPTTVLAQTLQSFFLPQLSKLQEDAAQFARMAYTTIEAGFLVSAAQAIGFALFGPAVLILLFGSKYGQALEVLIWLAVMQAIRVAKAGPVIVAIAKGETRNPLVANLVRVAFIPLAYWIVAHGGSVMSVAWVALAGEGAALSVSLWRVRRNLKISFRPIVLPALAMAAVLAAVGVDAAFWPPGTALLENVHLAQLGVVAAGLVFLLTLRRLRAYAWARFRSGKARVESQAPE